jgi:hypothetical protein
MEIFDSPEFIGDGKVLYRPSHHSESTVRSVLLD